MTAARRRVRRETSRPSLFWPAAAIVIPVVSLFAKIEFIDKHRLPAEGSYILAPNHYSELDPVVVAVALFKLGREPRFMAKESLFRIPVVGAVMRALGMVPVARNSSSSAATATMDAAQRLVENGQGVTVYAEGSLTRDPDLWPMRGKTGVARLALAGGIPVIPVATWGVQEIMPRYGKFRFFAWRRTVRMKFGEPIDLTGYAADRPIPAYVDATDEVMNAVAALVGDLRGETPPAQRWDPVKHGQRETGRES